MKLKNPLFISKACILVTLLLSAALVASADPIVVNKHTIAKDPVALGESVQVCAELHNTQNSNSGGSLRINFRPAGGTNAGVPIAADISFSLAPQETKFVCTTWQRAGTPYADWSAESYQNRPGQFEICSRYTLSDGTRSRTYTNCRRFTISGSTGTTGSTRTSGSSTATVSGTAKCYFKPSNFATSSKSIPYESGKRYNFWGYTYYCNNGQWTKTAAAYDESYYNRFDCFGTHTCTYRHFLYTPDWKNSEKKYVVTRLYVLGAFNDGRRWYYERIPQLNRVGWFNW